MRGSPREAGGTYGVGNYELWLHGWYDKGTSLGFTVCRAVALFCSPHPRLIRVHHSGSPPEEKLRISTRATARQHFTNNDISPNNNTLALRRCLSHKITPHASDRPARTTHKHPNAYTNHTQAIPAADPTRHRCHPKHHQSTPQPIPKRLPSKRHLLTRPRRTQQRQRTRPTPPQRTKVALRVDAHQRMPPVAHDCRKPLGRP